MIRPFTCLTVLLAAGSGLYLYTEKHRTTVLDERIRAVVDDTHRIEDRTSMLRAEWALLNQPDRLQALASKFLPHLQPMAPTQFVQESDLDKHLPPVGAPASPPSGATAAVASALPASVLPASGLPTSAAPPSLLASAPKTNKTPVVRVAAHLRRVADRKERLAPQSLAPQAVVRPVVSYARPRPMLASSWHAAPAFTGSALGMAHVAMPPPVAPPMAAPMRVGR